MDTVQAVETLTAWRNGSDDHPLTDLVLAVKPAAEVLDHPDRLVPENQA
jgi:hypothetical protein